MKRKVIIVFTLKQKKAIPMDLEEIEHQLDEELHHVIDVVKMKNILLVLILIGLAYLYLVVI